MMLVIMKPYQVLLKGASLFNNFTDSTAIKEVMLEASSQTDAILTVSLSCQTDINMDAILKTSALVTLSPDHLQKDQHTMKLYTGMENLWYIDYYCIGIEEWCVLKALFDLVKNDINERVKLSKFAML